MVANPAFGQVLFVWAVAIYVALPVTRSVGWRLAVGAAFGGVTFLALADSGHVVVTLLGAAALTALGMILVRVQERVGATYTRWAAETTLLGLIVLIVAVYVTVAVTGATGTNLRHPSSVPLTVAELHALPWILAASAFLIEGGSWFVRGILSKAGSLPEAPRISTVGTEEWEGVATEPGGASMWELRLTRLPGGRHSDGELAGGDEAGRGRLIGILERLILFGLVLTGSYGAIGFLIAAKGLVRAREFEDREFAEYFLVGTLASTGLALLVGELLGFAVLG